MFMSNWLTSRERHPNDSQARPVAHREKLYNTSHAIHAYDDITILRLPGSLQGTLLAICFL
jgi:hypothetical protein